MRKLDLVKQQFGHLMVVEEAQRHFRPVNGKNVPEVMWVCKCDCGRTKNVSSRQLREGMSVSCGDVGCEFHNPIKHADPREGSLRYLYQNYICNASTRKYAFELTLEQFRDLTAKDCHYCGKHPSASCLKSWRGMNPETTKNQPYIYNGVDRVDNAVGYVVGNCVPCCKICNIMKQGLSKTEFLNHIRSIFLHEESSAQCA